MVVCAAEQLPDADKLFSSVKKPSFLDYKSCKTDIDWDQLAKSKVQSSAEACSNTHTVPPPVSYDPQSAALKPTLGDPHEAILKERKGHVKDTDADSAGLYMRAFFWTDYIAFICYSCNELLIYCYRE